MGSVRIPLLSVELLAESVRQGFQPGQAGFEIGAAGAAVESIDGGTRDVDGGWSSQRTRVRPMTASPTSSTIRITKQPAPGTKLWRGL